MRRKSYALLCKIFCMIVLVAVILSAGTWSADGWVNAYADTQAADFTGYIQVSTPQDMQAMAKNPSGTYVLTADIDMSGVSWTPFTFKGVLNGNGYAILNLNVISTGTDTALTYDGNMKQYDTSFAGLFSVLSGAEVSNLKLINEQVDITTDKDCFVGSIAGFMEDSTITDCTIQAGLNITADAKMFGVGGIVGFGNGTITNTTAAVTMVCIDSNVEYKEEQFMGGAYGAGYVNVDNCVINIDGYVSDHGYVHNGGLTGMFEVYTPGVSAADMYLTNNVIDGKITFFEDNADRRAYCSAIAGETMSWGYDYTGNTDSFIRDEVYDYSVNLKPDMCTAPSYKETVTEPSEDSFGYTTYECVSCGYTYTDKYTIYKSPEETAAGEQEQSAQESATEIYSDMAEENNDKELTFSTILIIAGAVLIVIGIVAVIIRRRRK